jgi:hypothetical protein
MRYAAVRLICAGLLTLLYCGCAQREQFLREHPTDPFAEQIRSGQVAIGESQEEILATFGKVMLCSVVQSTHGAMWEYCGLSSDLPSTFIYFDQSGRVSDVTTVTN